ncbi:aspartate--tRNA ligase 2, cytoplasmic-like isoform X1 [Macadamia integrifolia]|uniref:aspartate--tRNA ligase 2, cytoplasmic-like isoform X1 n=1 Tax=Macadamia integrifolia TaxID=60698 RepID=UPI001C52C8B2|nr:aspartate--tRNA ligase 2, cytoplasmic-like isoform X1 [Macadamia integrifolia]
MEIKEHYFEYLRKTLRLTFQEGVRMLKAGVEVDPLGDLNTEAERKLDQLVCDKYDTDFYILHGYPLAVRPFYTMLCYNDSAYSNSFDVFIRDIASFNPYSIIYCSLSLELVVFTSFNILNGCVCPSFYLTCLCTLSLKLIVELAAFLPCQ